MTDDSTPDGLSTAQARQRLQADGPNEIGDRDRRTLRHTLGDIATEPMFGLLVVAAAVYLVIGDLGEGLLLAFFALVTIGLVLAQERRSEHALQALRDLSAPQARVARDGRWVTLAARELVRGDCIALGEGDRIPADACLRQGHAVAVDESLLTGESVPVRKSVAPAGRDPEPSAPGGEDQPWVYAGTLVVAGHAWAEVTATGPRTEMGRIGATLASIDAVETPLQQQLRRLVRAFGLAAAAACIALLVWYGLSRGAWVQGLLAALALAMAMLPEEFPMALAVFLALGAWRLAHAQVLSRHPAAIEALGSVTLLAVDKTGTLTENRMRVAALSADAIDWTVDDGAAPAAAVKRLVEVAALASRRGSADPMDRAAIELADRVLAGAGHGPAGWRLAQEYPLSDGLLAMAQAWEGEGRRHVAAKGAPEAVFDLCHLDAAAHAHWGGRARRLADAGLRVLGLASAETGLDDRAGHVHDIAFRIEGLIAYADPLRASVPQAVAQAREAGIAVAMITGDHAATAVAIARQAGLDVDAGALTGPEIEGLDDARLDERVRTVRVFARVLPHQKLRLVEAFQRNGETVAMTGDGVNDAPALKAAHIGIAMGVRGTDVAREAADIVLLQEDFGRIVGGIRMGRRIVDNLRKVMTYITAIHVPIAGLALLPILFGLPPLMLPAHVVLTEMVIDPACSLAFEGAPEDPRVMQRPPRRADEPFIGRPLLLRGIVQGACVLAATLAIDAAALHAGRSEDVARTLALLGLTFGNLLLVALNLAADTGLRALTGASARAFWAITAAAGAALAGALAVPGLRSLLHLQPPDPADLLAALAAVAASVGLAAVLTHTRGRVA